MADALSIKTHIVIAMTNVWALTEQLADWHPWSVVPRLIYNATVSIDLLDRIWITQWHDSRYK